MWERITYVYLGIVFMKGYMYSCIVMQMHIGSKLVQQCTGNMWMKNDVVDTELQNRNGSILKTSGNEIWTLFSSIIGSAILFMIDDFNFYSGNAYCRILYKYKSIIYLLINYYNYNLCSLIHKLLMCIHLCFYKYIRPCTWPTFSDNLL